jgi:hypothetical protein
MSTAGAQQYFVIPLSVQKDGDDYLVGNAEMGDFYQFPEQGVKILNMLKSGFTAPVIQSCPGLRSLDTRPGIWLLVQRVMQGQIPGVCLGRSGGFGRLSDGQKLLWYWNA